MACLLTNITILPRLFLVILRKHQSQPWNTPLLLLVWIYGAGRPITTVLGYQHNLWIISTVSRFSPLFFLVHFMLISQIRANIITVVSLQDPLSKFRNTTDNILISWKSIIGFCLNHLKKFYIGLHLTRHVLVWIGSHKDLQTQSDTNSW